MQIPGSRHRLPALAPALAIPLGAWCAVGDSWNAAAAIVPFLVVLGACTAHGRRVGWTVFAVVAAFLLGARLARGEIERSRQARIASLGHEHGYDERDWGARVLASAEREFDGGRRLRLVGRPETAPPGDALALDLRIPAGPADSIAGIDRLRAGDRVRVWCRAGVPEAFRNPGAEDPALALRAVGIDALGHVKSGRLVVGIERARAGPGALIDGVRRELRRRIERVADRDEDVAGVLKALLLGERGAMRPAVREGMRDGGVAHVLAVSGLHVSILVLIAAVVLSPAPPLARGLSIAAATLAFAVLVGARASVARAAILGVSAIAVRALGRKGAAIQTLALAAAGLTLARPLSPLDPGFQLSFCAVASILATAGRIEAVTTFVPRPLRAPLSISFAAYAGTLPVLATRFHRVTPAAAVTNLLAIPACAAAVVCGLAAIALDGVPGIGPPLAALARVSVRALLLAGDVGGMLGGPATVPPPGPLAMIMFLAAWVALAGSSRTRPSPAPTWFALAACASFHLGPPPGAGEPAGVFLVDVGQGQALFSSDGRGSCVVLDAGGSWSPRFDPGERILVPELLRHGCRRIPLLVLSHDHLDHVGGARAVLRALAIDELWVPPGSAMDGLFRPLSIDVRAGGGAVVGATRGTRRSPPGCAIEVIHPTARDLDLGVNDRSLVVRLRQGAISFLVAGDLEATGERSVLQSGQDLSADILVVGHHGSRDASSPSFLDAVEPREAWISVGRGNRFGHPSPEVVERLESRRVRIRRTDIEGRIAAGSAEPDRNRHEGHEEQDPETDGKGRPGRTDR